MIAKDYCKLYTNLYASKPKAMATLTAQIGPLVHLSNQCFAMLDAFDVDTATGQQLDTIGAWVGIPRVLDYRIAGYYFNHDGTALEGWDNGVWYTVGDPTSTITTLGDGEYRSLIRATIKRNNSRGTVADIHAIILAAFPALKASLQVIDNQDMTIRINYNTAALNSVQIGLLEGLAVPFKPSCVGVTFNK